MSIFRNKLINLKIYAWPLGVSFGPMTVGFILAYSSPALRDLSGFLTITEISLFVSLMYIGGIVGSLIIGNAMDHYGRKWSITYSILTAILSWIILIAYNDPYMISKNVYILIFARFLAGVSCGMNLAVTAVYLIEIAPANQRGIFGCVNQVGLTFGIMICYIYENLHTYDFLTKVGMVLSLMLFFISLFIPESPRWLINKGKHSEAFQSLKRLRPETVNIELEIQEITSKATSNLEKTSNISMIQLITLNVYRQKALLIIQLMLLQQLTGINAFIGYADLLFVEMLRNYQYINLLPVTIGIFQFIFSLISLIIVEQFGRKIFLHYTGSVMTISLFIISVMSQFDAALLMLTGLVLYIVGYSIGWGPIPIVVATEILPQEIRGIGSALAILTTWVGGYIVTVTFPLFQKLLGNSLTFLIYSIICGYSVVFVAKFLPETKEDNFDNNKNNSNKISTEPV